jgi:hypothetical protein
MFAEYATAARKKQTVLAAEIITEWIQNRADIGDGLPVKSGERTPLIHDLFAEMEERIAATLSSQSEGQYGVQVTLERLVVLVENLALAFLLHAPETPESERGKVIERGQRRIDTFLAKVNLEVKKRRGEK